MNKKKSFVIKVLFVSLPLIALDIISKLFAIAHSGVTACIAAKQICFRYTENTGIAFSIPIPMLAITIINTLLLFGILKLAVDEFKLNKITLLSISLILAGGVGNLIDRFLRSYVVDFISISKFPIFNIADIYISVAVLIIIVFYGKIKR